MLPGCCVNNQTACKGLCGIAFEHDSQALPGDDKEVRAGRRWCVCEAGPLLVAEIIAPALQLLGFVRPEINTGPHGPGFEPRGQN
jgi:hypothetical protein